MALTQNGSVTVGQVSTSQVSTPKVLWMARGLRRWITGTGVAAALCGALNIEVRPAHAVEAAPIVRTLKQPNGKSFQARQRGDEWFHWMETTDGRPIALDTRSRTWYYTAPGRNGGVGTVTRTPVGQRAPVAPFRPGTPPQAQARRGSAATRVVPPAGTGLVPVILVNFSDRSTQFTSTQFDNLLFGSGKSMKAAFTEMSGGKFTVSAGPGTVVGWYTASRNHAYYGANANGGDAHAGQLVKEAVTAADAAGFNFAPYDQDGDGYVDIVNIVHQGTGEEVGLNANDIWSHRWSLNAANFYDPGNAGQYQTNDGVKVNDYVIQPELLNPNTMMTVGVFVHEYGHALGLPDLYDTDSSSEGLGDWSLMAGGSWTGTTLGGDSPCHMDPWSKSKLGWLQPTVVTENTLGASLPNVAGGPFAYKLWTNGVPGNEYFIVENRQKTGFDAGIPASGLVVYHVDESLGGFPFSSNNLNTKEWYPGNTSSGHYLIRVVQPDNLWQLEKDWSRGGNRGNIGDVFTAGKKLDESGAVNSRSYAGSDTLVAIKNISGSAATMTADLFVKPPTAALTLSVQPVSFSEAGGANAATGTVSRSAISSQALTVTLASSDTGAARVPASVTIAANQASATFAIEAVDDQVATGTRTATLVATSVGLTAAATNVSVLDNDGPALFVTLLPTLVSETAGNGSAGTGAAIGTVTRNTTTTSELRVTLASSDVSEATVQESIVIAAGSTSATFPITAIDDLIADGSQNVMLSATANGIESGSAALTVLDNEVAGLTLTIAPAQVSENGGVTAAVGTVTRNTSTDVELAVALSSSDSSAVTVPATVTIPVGAAAATFPIAAVNDVALDGSQVATIIAGAANMLPSSADITVADDDVPSLFLTLDQSTLSEGATAVATISLNLTAPSDITVVLSNPSPNSLRMPAAVVIGAGTTSTTFNVESPDDANANGNQTVVLGAEAAGFAPSTATVSVVDNDTPQIALTAALNSISENGGVVTVTASHNMRTEGPVVVALTSNDATEATAPPAVVIPAGSSSATFTVAAVDDFVIDGSQPVTITASWGSISAATSFVVTDDEVPSLTLSIGPRVTEKGAALQATVTRNTMPTAAMAVQLSSTNPAALLLPASVTIPAGRASATFAVSAIDNDKVDGARLVTVRAAATGLAAATKVVEVRDNDVAALTLAVLPLTFSESGGLRAAKAKVTRNTATRALLTVTLSSSNINAARVPTRVVIPAGKESAEFFVAAVDNAIADGSRIVTLTARASAHREALAKPTVSDNDVASLALSLAPGSTSEKGGRITGVVSHNGVTTQAVAVQLVSSNAREASVPASVTIAAGRSTATFEIRGVDEDVADGSQRVSITARASGRRQAVGEVTVLDDEKPTLTLTITPGEIRENAGLRAATATLTRNTPKTSLLTVALRNSNPSKVRLPGSVSLPPGAASVTFTIDALDNLSVDGSQRVTITASQTGYTAGTAILTVLDNDGAAPRRNPEDDEIPAATSPVTLSSAAISAQSATITLRFTGALDADAASDASSFSVTVEGKVVEVETAMWNARTQSALLQLPEGVLISGDKVLVAWHDLRDARGAQLRDSTNELVAR